MTQMVAKIITDPAKSYLLIGKVCGYQHCGKPMKIPAVRRRKGYHRSKSAYYHIICAKKLRII